MRKYLYIFGYETPEQHLANAENGWEDEDTQAVFIISESESEALEWGREIAERFVSWLYQDETVSWKAMNFAHWIEQEPEVRIPLEQLNRIPSVPVGQWPA